jgi:microcystin-dependent protein
MPTPTYNKWKSTTIYGNLSVRDLTNSAGTSVVEVASIDLSGNFLSRGDSTFTKAVTCNGTITNGTHLATKTYVDNAVSGGSILGTANAWTNTNTFNSYLPTSTQTPTTSTQLTTKTYVDSGISTAISGLSSVYQTISGMSSYLTTSTASSTYQTISGMSSYLTTATASSTYSTLTNQVKTNIANTFTEINYFNKEISQEYITIPSSAPVNKFIKSAFREAITLTGISQDGTAVNQLDNLTLGGDVGSSLGLSLTSNAGITQIGTATNTLSNLTIGDSGLIIKDVLNNVVLTIATLGITQSDTGATNTYDGESIFNGTLTTSNGLFPDSISQYNYRGTGNYNRFVRSIFDEQAEMYSILEAKTSTAEVGMRVATGDYPYLSTNSPYTTPQIFTITSQQTIAGSQISINQTTTTATNTANYSIANSIISTFTIPANFSKKISLNIPISIRNAGTWTLSGTALSATITNTINSMTATMYVNGAVTSWGTVAVTAQNSNSLTRSTQISYTTTGTKTISLDQYFFNVVIDTPDFFNQTQNSRNNNITNTIQIVLSANITNTIVRVTNTGNFTATNTLTFVANTGISTISNTSTASTSISYSPNSNGTGYAAATTTSSYNDTSNTTGGTTYTNHLRANSFNLLPAGMVVQWVTSTAPTGWLLCDGTAYNASSNSIYQELYNVIGNQFGGTNNSNFKVPDYRGMFLRGAGTNAQTGYTTYVGQTLNTQQTDAVQEHTHNTDLSTRRGTASDSANFIMSSNNVGSANTQTQTTSTQSGRTSSVETRPVSYSVNYLIKY